MPAFLFHLQYLLSSCSLSQEPGSAEEIKAYASSYGAEFDMFAKVDVNGAKALPLYKFLKSQLRGSLGSFIKWNYAKVSVQDVLFRTGIEFKLAKTCIHDF